MDEKQLKEYEIFLEEKITNYYQNTLKDKENLDEILHEELKELFIKIGTTFIYINALNEGLKEYKKDNKNKVYKNLNMYIKNTDKLIAIFDLAIQVFEDIYKKLGKIPEWE